MFRPILSCSQFPYTDAATPLLATPRITLFNGLTSPMDPLSSSPSIALLIDADNAPAAKVDFMISELAKHGMVNIRRAYGNWTKSHLNGWQEVLHEYAIQPIQTFDLTKGKNASDMSLAIDAMDILYMKNVTTFAIASSDCDFTPLIQRLRAEGKQVIGFGAKTTPEPFINSCTRFLYIDGQPETKPSPGDSDPRANSVKTNKKLLTLLRRAVSENEDDEGWASISAVGNYLRNQGSFDQRNYGYAKLSGLLHAAGVFDERTNNNGSGTTMWVRLKKS